MTSTPLPRKAMTSDNITVLSGSLDLRTASGARDYQAVAVALTIFNYYIASAGAATVGLDTIAKAAGIDRRTAIKYTQSISEHLDTTRGYIGRANRYALKPGFVASIDDAWAMGNRGVPNAVNAEEGVVARAANRPRQVFERFDGEVPTDWFVDGTFAAIDAFKEPGQSPAERLALTGIRHNLDLAHVASQLSYPTLEARGFSFDIARLLSRSTGYATVAAVVFKDALGLNDKKLARLNKALIASGLWRIDADRHTNQLVYTPTPFLLAQVAVYYNRRRLADADGNYSGMRLDHITKNHPHIEPLVATHAVKLGVNDQMGTADTPTDNPAAPSPGTVWEPITWTASEATTPVATVEAVEAPAQDAEEVVEFIGTAHTDLLGSTTYDFERPHGTEAPLTTDRSRSELVAPPF